MPVIDLISMIDTNTYLHNFVEKILRKKFANKIFKIDEPKYLMPWKPENFSYFIDEQDDSFVVSDMETALMILERFGFLIKSISAVNDYQMHTAMKIHEYINLYCSESLMDLHIHVRYSDIFWEYKKPFENVVHLKFDGIYKNYSNSDFTFGEIFPSLNHLDLGQASIAGLLDEQTVPQMKELSIFCFDDWKRQYIERFLKNNPQIKCLNLVYVRPELLKFVADEFPSLEKLTLKQYNSRDDDDSTDLHFEHVRSFSVSGNFVTLMPSNIIFANLEEFELRSLKWPKDNVFDLIAKHKETLKNLKLLVFLQNSDILHLANVYLNVIEMDIKCERGVDIKTVIKLIENSFQLKKLNIFFEYFIDKEWAFDALKTRFANELKVTQSDKFFYLDDGNRITVES